MLIAVAKRAYAAAIGAGGLAATIDAGCGPANESPCVGGTLLTCGNGDDIECE